MTISEILKTRILRQYSIVAINSDIEIFTVFGDKMV